MRVFLTMAICLCILFSCEHAQNKTTKFQDEKGKFKISFPTKPEIIKQSSETEYGKINTYSFKSEPKNDDNLSYEVHYLEYPESFTDTLNTKSTHALFNGTQTTNINSENIELTSSYNIKILGHLGREYRWKDNITSELMRVRLYMVSNRMYILIVKTNGKNNFNVGINQFFESFELINTEAKPEEQSQLEKKKKVYNVKFPKPTEIKEMESLTEYGNAKVIAEAYQPKLENDDNLIYMIATLEYPEDITKRDDFNLDAYYSSSVQSALAGRQSTLIGKKKISKNRITGIEVKESLKDGQVVIKQRTFLKGNLKIAIQVMTIPSNDENDSMNAFLDSFEFVDD